MKINVDRAVGIFFPRTAFYQVYFEAVANALDAGATEISIVIRSDRQAKEFEVDVTDNGRGFTDEDFDRFKEITEPRDKYHKGLGRLVYMAYFDRVEVESTFGPSRRRFTFSPDWNEESEVVPAPAPAEAQTVLRFRAFRRSKLAGYADLKPGEIRERLIQQFYPLLHAKKRNGAFLKICIELQTEGNRQRDFFGEVQTVTPQDVPDLEYRAVEDPTNNAFAEIELWYKVEPDAATPVQMSAVSVDERAVPLDIIDARALPRRCTAIFLVKSEIFAGKSDITRARVEDPVFMDALKKVLQKAIGEILNERVPEIPRHNKRTRADFEHQYPHLGGLFGEDSLGLIDREEAIQSAQMRFIAQQQDVLRSDPMDDESFKKSLEVSARALTAYVLYRQHIITRLERTPASALEDEVHNLIVPKREQFTQDRLIQDVYRNNAWLLDDKFMTFQTILSEARMHEVISAITRSDENVGGDGRPDISMVFSADPDVEQNVDVVVVELKRRAPDPKESQYAAVQLAERAELLVNHCPSIQRIWYYGIIEIDDPLSRRLRTMNWTPLFSRGDIFFQEFLPERSSDGRRVPAPTFLISFDAIVRDAAARNKTFLELLRSGFRGTNSDDC